MAQPSASWRRKLFLLWDPPHRQCGRPQPADLRVRERDHRPDKDPADPVSARPPPLKEPLERARDAMKKSTRGPIATRVFFSPRRHGEHGDSLRKREGLRAPPRPLWS